MKAWKISFWIAVTLLIVSKIFWIYLVIDTAVGHEYYQASCAEFKEKSDILYTTLDGFENIDDLTAFLEKYEMDSILSKKSIMKTI